MSAEPTVIYLAGSGRSGSTLLERTLGEIPGFVNVGELIDLFPRAAPRGERCGCGREFGNCPFWARVGAEAFGGWDAERLSAMRLLQHHVARQRHIPRLLAIRLAGRTFRDEVTRYGSAYARLYRAIADEARAGYVVDASKWPAQALALFRSGVDIRVIHLVRDVRGVAHSLSRQHVARPHAVREADVMWHVSPASAAARWVVCQSEVALLKDCGLTVTRVLYEDFVLQPRQTTEMALAAIGVPVGPAHLSHIGDEQVVLGISHGLSGNPSRFQTGEIPLRADETWRAQMSVRDRALVTAIGLPHLLRYRADGAGGAPSQARLRLPGRP